MPKYTFMPTFNIEDEAQTVDTIDKAKQLAAEFLRKFGGPDCLSLTIVEVRTVGTMEYVSPIFTPSELTY